MKLRTVLILATMLLGGMLLSGVALADKISCTASSPCRGSKATIRLKAMLTGTMSTGTVAKTILG
jgi:hypothetical protein